MYPGREIEIGIDLIWQYNTSDIPGAVVSEALNDGDNIKRHCTERWPRDDSRAIAPGCSLGVFDSPDTNTQPRAISARREADPFARFRLAIPPGAASESDQHGER